MEIVFQNKNKILVNHIAYPLEWLKLTIKGKRTIFYILALLLVATLEMLLELNPLSALSQMTWLLELLLGLRHVILTVFGIVITVVFQSIFLLVNASNNIFFILKKLFLILTHQNDMKTLQNLI